MLKYNDNARHIHRLPPCPIYDVESFQTWLSDMAAQGYLLDRDGFFFGFASFEVATPCIMEYRLQAARKKKSAFDEGEPDEEETELSEALGWEYVARKEDFQIYRSADPAARELNTDPHVQALALSEVIRRTGANRAYWIFELFFWLILYPALVLDFKVLLFSTVIGTGLTLFALFLALWTFAGHFAKSRQLKLLRERLRLGGSTTGKADWRSGAVRHRALWISHKLCVAAWFIAIISMALGNFGDQNDIPITSLEVSPPFATVAQLYPGAEYEPDNSMNSLGLNSVERWSAAIAPENWYWRESADLTYGELSWSVSLYLNYHETVSPLLARGIAWEYHMEDRRSKYYEELTLPELGLDYALAYRDVGHSIHVILQNDKVVIHATLSQYGQNTLRLDQWAAALAESIKLHAPYGTPRK